jgi:hypothetical protein
MPSQTDADPNKVTQPHPLTYSMTMPNCFAAPLSPSPFSAAYLAQLRRTSHRLLALWALLVVAGCAANTHRTETNQPAAAQHAPVVVATKAFDADTFYALLVAEVAGDRQRFDVMLNNYVEQANVTLDPGVIERAAHLARYLNDRDATMAMAELWLKSAPASPEAHYVMLSELINANRLVDAVAYAEFLQTHGETSGFDAIAARAQQTGQVEVSRQLLALYEPFAGALPQRRNAEYGRQPAAPKPR